MAKAPKRPAAVPADAIWDVDEWLACARDDEGRFQGLYRNWYPDGRLKYEGTVKDSQQQGEHKTYHPDGSLYRIAIWRDGEVHDDQYIRTHGETDHEFPEDVEQIWRVEHLSRDGKSDYTSRYYDEAGRELDLYGEPVPARPSTVPADARYESTFVMQSVPPIAEEMGEWFGKQWSEGHGWVDGAIDREDDLRLGTWRWWSPEGKLVREDVHDDRGLLLSAREWDAGGRETRESMEDKLAALRGQLDRAYEVFLGKPLASFDANATYAFYFCIEDAESAPSASGFDSWADLTWAELAAPPTSTPARAGDKPRGELAWDRFAMDRGRSIFFVNENKLRGSGGKKPVSLTGAALAEEAQRADHEPEDLLGDFVYVRAQTDGSLRDAMAAATWTMSAPLGLITPEYDREEKWVDKLAAVVSDARLRGHLEMLCATDDTARCAGGFFLGNDTNMGMWDWVMTELEGEVLAAWQFGEGFASAAVIKLPPA